MDIALLEQLLAQTESEHLDFKKGLYVKANYDSLFNVTTGEYIPPKN